MTPEDLTIVHHPERCSGHPTVGHTRICVHNIIGSLRLYNGDRAAWRAEEGYPYSDALVDAALAYYEANPAEIEGIMAAQRRAYAEGLAAQDAAARARMDFSPVTPAEEAWVAEVARERLAEINYPVLP